MRIPRLRLGMTRFVTFRFSVMLAAVLCAACDSGPSVQRLEASPRTTPTLDEKAELARARQDSVVRARPGYIVDSILPVVEEIRRFNATNGERPPGFAHGATSRSSLVKAFVSAIEQNDTTALARLVIDRNEFGYLVYPSSPNTAPPYRQSPDLVWTMRSAGTEKAAKRLLGRFGGRPLGFQGYSCPTRPERQGDNTLWSGCVVRSDAATELRMFGAIIERDGRFKFLALTNGL
jgi:hypothetical protein